MDLLRSRQANEIDILGKLSFLQPMEAGGAISDSSDGLRNPAHIYLSS
jgi:hypothetical protein